MEDTSAVCSAEDTSMQTLPFLQQCAANILSLSLVIETGQEIFAPAECQEGCDPCDACMLPMSAGAQDLLSQQ